MVEPDEGGITLTRTWSTTNPQVKRALRFVTRRAKMGRPITAEELVEWDRDNGGYLFTWDDQEAANLRRIDEARNFMNRFRTQIDGMRVKFFIGVPREALGVEERGKFYLTSEQVSGNQVAREIVIEDLQRRVDKLVSELRFWNLSTAERNMILARVKEVLGIEE